MSSDVNNNNNRAAIIRKENDEKKVNFIKNNSYVLIPADLIVLPKTNINKILYYQENDRTVRREYLYFENNSFYCSYCLCFSFADDSDFVKGVEYVRGNRLPTKLSKHDSAPYHLNAKRIFEEKSTTPNGEIQQSTKRNALKAIFKILIFLATNGKRNNNVVSLCVNSHYKLQKEIIRLFTDSSFS